MAIQAQFTTFHGEVIEDAYIRIEKITGQKTEFGVNAEVYSDGESEDSIESIRFAFEYDEASGENISEQAYGALELYESIVNPIAV